MLSVVWRPALQTVATLVPLQVEPVVHAEQLVRVSVGAAAAPAPCVNDPAAHVKHCEAPLSLYKLSAPQRRHFVRSSTEWVPAGQGKQPDWPSKCWKAPTGQPRHSVCCGLGWYLPCWHDVQADWPGFTAKWPATHVTHVCEPGEGCALPALHAKHSYAAGMLNRPDGHRLSQLVACFSGW